MRNGFTYSRALMRKSSQKEGVWVRPPDMFLQPVSRFGLDLADDLEDDPIQV